MLKFFKKYNFSGKENINKRVKIGWMITACIHKFYFRQFN